MTFYLGKAGKIYFAEKKNRYIFAPRLKKRCG
jgi:hypothetical protein